MTFKEFTKTEDYKWSDVVYIVDENGEAPDVDDDWLTDESEVVSWKKCNEPASLEITIKKGVAYDNNNLS